MPFVLVGLLCFVQAGMVMARMSRRAGRGFHGPGAGWLLPGGGDGVVPARTCWWRLVRCVRRRR
jgi:hypothetical protein